MHGTAGVSTKATLTHGGLVATLANRSFDADEVWRCVEDARITMLTIVGDVFSRPLLDALDAAAAAGRPYDLSSLRTIVSSGIMWSEQVKRGDARAPRRDARRHPRLERGHRHGAAGRVATAQGRDRALRAR